MWAVVAGIIGARLYHVVTDWSRFSDDLGSIPKIWEGGLGIPGGLLAGIVVGAWQAKRRGIRAAVVLTFGAPAIALAQAIGRWGNWFNQELFGKPTDLPWALEIDDEHLPAGYPSGTTFHPAFLYESLWNFALCGFLLWVQRRFQLAAGRLMGVYLIGYGIGRFWIEGLRIDPSHEVAGLRWNQWVSLAAIAGGTIYLLATWGKKWDELPATVDASSAPVEHVRDADAVIETDDPVDPRRPVDADALATGTDPAVPHRALGELLVVVRRPTGDAGDREEGRIAWQATDEHHGAEPEVDVRVLAQPAAGLHQHLVDDAVAPVRVGQGADRVEQRSEARIAIAIDGMSESGEALSTGEHAIDRPRGTVLDGVVEQIGGGRARRPVQRCRRRR